MTSGREGALKGTTVLDLTRFASGSYCTMLLADQGASVIKIEPIGGEETRSLPPTIGPTGSEVSLPFAEFNRNKMSICLDLNSQRGRGILEDLVRKADVLVENFRPGVLDELGFSGPQLDAINGRLIYCSISAFGHTDTPYRERPTSAPVVEAMAGLTRFNPHDGDPPLTMGLPIGDLFPGILAMSAITMALIGRLRTGVGMHIDMSQYDSMLSLNERSLLFTAMLGFDVQPGAPAMTSTPSGIFRAKDGYVCFSVVGEKIWERFCRVIGQEQLLSNPRLTSGPARAEVFSELLFPLIDAWLRERTREEAVRDLVAGDVPAGEVMSALEVLDDEQAMTREAFLRVPTYSGVDVTVPDSPIRLGHEGRRQVMPIPSVGEHTVDVLRSLLGYEIEEIEELTKVGIVATSSKSAVA